MKTDKLIWIPRVLAIVFIVFLMLFSVDTFSGDAPFLKKLGGFLIHSIPSLVLLLVLLIFWKKPLISGSLFILFGVAFALYFNTFRVLSTFLLTTSPFLLVGIIFVWLGLKAKKA
jgi:hypothetical protein